MKNPDVTEQPATTTPVACSELLACPFCGELPEYEPWPQGHDPLYFWPHQIVHNCKIIGEQICVRVHKSGIPDTKESVFSIWNTRDIVQANETSSPATPVNRASQTKGTQ